MLSDAKTLLLSHESDSPPRHDDGLRLGRWEGSVCPRIVGRARAAAPHSATAARVLCGCKTKTLRCVSMRARSLTEFEAPNGLFSAGITRFDETCSPPLSIESSGPL